MDEIKVFAPATVANVGCGYDILGFALTDVGDELTLKKRTDSELVVTSIEGAEGIPTDPEKNVATVSIKAMLEALGSKQGFELSIKKNIAAGSGLGSSASSSAAAVFAANELLDRPYSKAELVQFAMEGERAASSKPHADNVAPSLMGGFTVIRSYDPLDLFNIPFPKELEVVVIFPLVEVKTSDAKKILKKQVNLSDAVAQWGNVAGLVSGLIEGNFARIGRSLQDVIVEPVRSILIPYYDEVKAMAMEKGALGFNISGSGPSMFALTNDRSKSEAIRENAQKLYDEQGIEIRSFISPINATGAEVI
ncbi:MAG: homoserine kinase [Cyclobacteriaceae bacterium]